MSKISSIVFINGSPKIKDSASDVFICQLKDMVTPIAPVYSAVQIVHKRDAFTDMQDILKADALVIVFPLYVDSLPASLIKLFTTIEQVAKNTDRHDTKVYAICNCGFYEAEHTKLALRMIENFVLRAGFTWGYGLGIGGGNFVISKIKDKDKGLAANVYAAFCELADALNTGKLKEQNIFVSPKIPRFIYKLGGHMGWRKMAKKYGTTQQLQAKPHQTTS